MIIKVVKMKGCGIFHDFKWTAGLPEFKKYNLIFGFNGSGKTTLSQAFTTLAPQDTTVLPDYDFEVLLDDGIKITNKAMVTLPNLIYVFNCDFVDKHLDTDGKLDEIVYLSVESIAKKNALLSAREELKKLEIESIAATKLYSEKKEIFEKLATEIGQKMKKNFQAIGGDCATTFGEYNRRNVERILGTTNSNPFFTEPNDDNEEKIKTLKSELGETSKPKIDELDIGLDKTEFNTFISGINKLLTRVVSQNVVASYSGEILSWVEKGLQFHETEDATKEDCLFCGGKITAERYDFLHGLFNKEYKALISKADEFLQELASYFPDEIDPVHYDFYAEQKSNSKTVFADLNRLISKQAGEMRDIEKVLNIKKSDTDKTDFILNLTENLVGQIIDKTKEINDIIKLHNDRTKQFNAIQDEQVKNLEKELLYKYTKEKNYFKLQKEHQDAIAPHTDKIIAVQQQKTQIKDLEDELQDTKIAAKDFNRLLHQFLGFDEIKLEYDDVNKGYKLLRKNGDKARRLSEGEKTAIAFIYFLTKIKENGNDIKNLIIVLDDPISSFDATNLFNAYSFIIAKLHDCHQLFLLTHNFSFFKLLREKYEKKKDPTKNKVELYLIYNDTDIKDGKKFRTAQIIELPNSLKSLDSEYAYCFGCVQKIISKEGPLELNEFFTLSNMCRKVLETFMSFKLMGCGVKGADKIQKLLLTTKPADTELSEEEIIKTNKIYKLINAMSHGINFGNEEEVASIIGEAKPTAQEVIDLIKEVDPAHYNSLLAI
jgi:wobble nucleotide-excising tRNase